MFKINFFKWFLLLSFGMILITGCNTEQSKTEDKSPAINAEFLKEQNELYEKVCQDFSTINQKVIELNNKIHSMKGKLTDEQNKALDSLDVNRNSVYNRMHSLKKVSQGDWEDFKTTLGKDIDNVKTQIDDIISTIN